MNQTERNSSFVGCSHLIHLVCFLVRFSENVGIMFFRQRIQRVIPVGFRCIQNEPVVKMSPIFIIRLGDKLLLIF